eukprot:12860449-Prorocentrum_lima.AAC.1
MMVTDNHYCHLLASNNTRHRTSHLQPCTENGHERLPRICGRPPVGFTICSRRPRPRPRCR